MSLKPLYGSLTVTLDGYPFVYLRLDINKAGITIETIPMPNPVPKQIQAEVLMAALAHLTPDEFLAKQLLLRLERQSEFRRPSDEDWLNSEHVDDWPF